MDSGDLVLVGIISCMANLVIKAPGGGHGSEFVVGACWSAVVGAKSLVRLCRRGSAVVCVGLPPLAAVCTSARQTAGMWLRPPASAFVCLDLLEAARAFLPRCW